jgi:TIR domain-containing protein/SH3 domain-containing protein
MKVFISHSNRDRWVARKISADLNEIGVETFLDEKDIETGESIDEAIGNQLKDCDECLIVLSPASLNSHWVLIEIGGAKALGKRLVPILLNIGVNDMPAPISKHLVRDINEIEKYYEEVKNRHSTPVPPRPRPSAQRQRAIEARKRKTFSVGDIVRLPSATPSPNFVDRPKYVITWNEKMDSYLGRVASVTEVDKDRSVRLDIDDGERWWAFEWLRKE